jgi:transposase
VSRFRNLLHHHTHTTHPGPACTFWAGCGAVRREPTGSELPYLSHGKPGFLVHRRMELCQSPCL